MTVQRISVACLGGTLMLVLLCYGVLYGSADTWRLSLGLVATLIVFIWWMVDRGALERRIRRLEARSEIADERRVTAQTNLTEVEHKLREVEDRVVDFESLSSPSQPDPEANAPPADTDDDSRNSLDTPARREPTSR
jgi:hypothetical protein